MRSFQDLRKAPRFPILAALLSAACVGEAPAPTDPTSAGVLADYVTPELASAISLSGELPIRYPEGTANRPLISPSAAGRLATAFVKTFGRYHHQKIQNDRRESFELSDAQPQDRIMFAESPYEIPPHFPKYVRQAFGPYYIVTFEVAGESMFLVAVSAHLQDYSVRSDGELTMPPERADDFFLEAIPRERVISSPEEAVMVAGRATQMRVRDVPVLLQRGLNSAARGTVLFPPDEGMWIVPLDGAILVAGAETGRLRATDTVYVDPAGALYAAMPEQPSDHEFTYAATYEPLRLARMRLPIRPAFAVAYEAIDIPTGQ